MLRKAFCPRCGESVAYVPEQGGGTTMCPRCGDNVPLRQAAGQRLALVVGTLVSALALATLTFFGLLGGLASLMTHGVLVLGLAGLAVMFGMRLRDVLLIFALFFGVVAGSGGLRTSSAKG